MRTLSLSTLILATALFAGCGDENVNINPDGGGPPLDDAGNPIVDGMNPNGDGGDGGGPGGCVTDGPQCNNCIDDDSDGLIDGFDIHCISALDNDEGSFATGIPGDNSDLVNQDCFFDGNSGAGNDGCNQHVCCILGAADQSECPYGANQYDPAECGLPAMCVDVCDAITPPGCDCFGCCTICDPADPSSCYDVYINPTVAPECDTDVLGDPTKCPTCAKSDTCGTVCEPTGCTLCPGQTADDLPAECNGNNTCPEGLSECADNTECTATEFCSSGCCIPNVQ